MTEQSETATVKCLVWDLDNTLWRGTLLEDGEVHLDDSVRRVIRTLDERGILQSVASRNNHDEAWARLEKLGVAEYFVAPQIGWGRKSDSVAHIAETLKFAQHTIAFIDDPNRPVNDTLWFNFDRLLFATNSATLDPSSQEQLRNIAESMSRRTVIILGIPAAVIRSTSQPQKK